MVKKKLTISPNGIDLIKSFEGLHDGNKTTPILEPQQDPVGYQTIGYGSRYDRNGRVVTATTPPITLEEAAQLLRRDISIAEQYIDKYVKVDLTQNQYDALCSLVFNIGSGNFLKSTVLKSINDGTLIPAYWKAWRKAGGIILPGLVKRREIEYALYCKT